MFHVKCTCTKATNDPTTIGLIRCHRCHGYKIQRTIPESATCKRCRTPATSACAVCFTGIDRLGGCPDCAWNWISFLGKDPCREYIEHGAEVVTIINKEALITCPRRNNAIEGIRKFMMIRTSSKRYKLKNKTYAMLW